MGGISNYNIGDIRCPNAGRCFSKTVSHCTTIMLTFILIIAGQLPIPGVNRKRSFIYKRI